MNAHETLRSQLCVVQGVSGERGTRRDSELQGSKMTMLAGRRVSFSTHMLDSPGRIGVL